MFPRFSVRFIISVGIAAAMFISSLGQIALARCAAFRQIRKLRVATLRKILHLDIEWHDREETSQLHSRLLQ